MVECRHMRKLSDDEIKTVILSFAHSRGEKGFYEKELEVIENWINKTFVDVSLLEAVLKGRMLIDVSNNEPVFSLSPAGRRLVEELGNGKKK